MRKVAFLVANDTFPKDPSIPPLRFTQNDARELAAVLEDRETCGFETRVYLNRPSQEVLTDLDQVSGEVGQDDTLLFYYSGHGKLRGNELCLVSNETITTSLGATSIQTRLVLEYLQGSLARRRILILDCCHSGAIGRVYKAVDSKSTLDGLADSFGSYILTASTTIQLAEEREKDGHGVFTKALIDCLREGPKERITINDLYEYAHSRLKVSAKQTPLFWALQQEGTAVEIGNYRVKHERERRKSLRQLIATARVKFDALQANGVFTQGQVGSILHILECNEATLFPHDRAFRNDVTRYLKGEVDFVSVLAREFPIGDRSSPPEPRPLGLVGAGTPRAPPIATPPERSILNPPVPQGTPEALPGTSGGGELLEAKKPILSLPATKALFIPAIFAIGVVILAVYFSFAPDTRRDRGDLVETSGDSNRNTDRIPEAGRKAAADANAEADRIAAENAAKAEADRIAAQNAEGGNRPHILKEIRSRLYELNFDTDPDLRKAIREFEKTNKMADTGTPTAVLLQRLREARPFKPWGAIVYREGEEKVWWGMSYGKDTRQAAVASARAKCDSPEGCQEETSFYETGCGVIAHGAFTHSDTRRAIVASNSIQQAKKKALSDCRKRGPSCRIIASVCADGTERYEPR